MARSNKKKNAYDNFNYDNESLNMRKTVKS